MVSSITTPTTTTIAVTTTTTTSATTATSTTINHHHRKRIKKYKIHTMQLPMLGGVDIKIVPLYFAVFVFGLLAYENASVIFTGGVGKNGSTVAVRTCEDSPWPLISKKWHLENIYRACILDWVATWVLPCVFVCFAVFVCLFVCSNGVGRELC